MIGCSRRHLTACFWLALFLSVVRSSAGDEPRSVISLDGSWQIAEGSKDIVPTLFARTVPVPGLVSHATPPFSDPPGPVVADRKSVGQKDPKRDAFWYRRTFILDKPIPAVARLKVSKAMFGTRVILNGQLLGEHLPCFTPGYFDARAALKTGENELLIRVGADRDAVGSEIPNGFDFEKARYIPGIFDSVELILCGTPHCLELQVVPLLETRSISVQAVLSNVGESVSIPLTYIVREAKSGRQAGRLITPTLRFPAKTRTTVTVEIPLHNCHLWSPEAPFLYTLELATGADTVRTRFGMREFRLAPDTGRAMLNGKPYFMRGSNITLYRFFEDAECGDLPWSENWVRLLHQRVKDMHWNCLRYCIGFPPEAWYDIADETGLLIQDEFPIWYGGSGWSTWPKALKSDELAIEYSEWLRERWNHPSVVIWDASNETTSTQTAEAVRLVKPLDLSLRPWDNSYAQPLDPGDVFESHPYHFNKNFRLSDLAKADPVPQGNERHNDGKNAVIINEYGWHWVNRDGTPTTLTKDLYETLLGTNASPQQRFHMQATWLAADTEFWRSHRKTAAVMHFTSLGYSRPDGQTCDHWQKGGVASLQWEPEFYQYVRDAFAPVGLSVDFWKDKVSKGAEHTVRVIVINDLNLPWHGTVRLQLLKSGATVPAFTAGQDLSLPAFGDKPLNFQLRFPELPGPYRLEASLVGSDGKPVHSIRELQIVDAATLGLSYLRPATASSSYSEAFTPDMALDGDSSTYWSSKFEAPAWLSVDLGETRMVSRVHITWENAYSKVFSILTSLDGCEWKNVFRETAGQGGISQIKFAPVKTRHVRINCEQRGTQWGNAIREFQVFE